MLGKSLAGWSRVISRMWSPRARMPEILLALPAAKSSTPLISLAYGLGDGCSGSSWRSIAWMKSSARTSRSTGGAYLTPRRIRKV